MLGRRLWAALALLSVTGFAPAADLKVKVFPGSQNLPLFAAQAQGYFARQGLAVELLGTKGSREQREGLARGEFQVAISAVDNAVAMAESGQDVVIVEGGDSSMNELLVQPEIRTLADLKGRTVLVDAPDTAYGVWLKKILLINGLKPGDYTMLSVGATAFRLKGLREHKEYKATMLNLPFSLEAKASGLKSIGRAVDLYGPYQGSGTFVLRSWAAANRELLERYIAATIEGVRWTVAPENRAAAAKLLAERLKIAPDTARQVVELIADPSFGLQADARFDMAGFRNVLAMRAEMERAWGGKPPAPERYVDLGYYEGAIRRLAR